MKTANTGIVAFVAIALCGQTWGDLEHTDQGPQELGLAIDLGDGSHLIGTPSIGSVRVQTPGA